MVMLSAYLNAIQTIPKETNPSQDKTSLEDEEDEVEDIDEIEN